MLTVICFVSTQAHAQLIAGLADVEVIGGQSTELRISLTGSPERSEIEIKQIQGIRAEFPKRLSVRAGASTTTAALRFPETDRTSQVSIQVKHGNLTQHVRLQVLPTFGLSATGVGNGNIAIDWEAVPSARHYDVFEISASGSAVKLLNDGKATHSVPSVVNRCRFIAIGGRAAMGKPRTFRVVANRPGRPLSSVLATGTSTEFDLPFTSKNPQDVIDKARENFLRRSPKGSSPPASLSILAPDGSTYTQGPPGTGPAVRVRSIASPKGKSVITDDGDILNSFPSI